MDLITKDTYEVQKLIKEKKESLNKTKTREKNKEDKHGHAIERREITCE